jgi:hypothetical protein
MPTWFFNHTNFSITIIQGGFSMKLTRPILIMGALSIIGAGGWMPGEASKAEASPWLAPAPHQDLAANWVADVDEAFRSPQVSNVFINVPFGSPHSTIIHLLNEAAIGVKTGHPRYARDLVRQAVDVLDKTAGEGWYSRSEVRPIQAFILKKAREGFEEAGHQWNQDSQSRMAQGDRERDHQWSEKMREGGVFEPDSPYKPRPRYSDYTSEHWQSGQSPRVLDQRQQNLEREQRQRMQSQIVRNPDRFIEGQYGESRGTPGMKERNRDLAQFQEQYVDPRGIKSRESDRRQFTEEDWRRHARQQGDSRSMREFDRNRDRNRFSQQDRFGDSRPMREFDQNRDRNRFSQQDRFGDSRRMRDFDRTREFNQNQGRDSRDMRVADRNRDREHFTDQDWREHARHQGEDGREVRSSDRSRDRDRFSQDRFGEGRSMRDSYRGDDRSGFKSRF